MGSSYPHVPVKLVIGFIYREESVYRDILRSLVIKFGPLDYESGAIEFTHTRYYETELGAPLTRRFVSFKKTIPPEKLVDIKLLTNRLEVTTSYNGARRINIDPGYVDLAKFILATTKNYRHRIYLTRGIFAEVTLYYRGKTYTAGECTYPDYRTPEYIGIFNKIRSTYAQQITPR